MKIVLGYTRDSKGKVVNYHPIRVANTLTSSTGGGGNTDQVVLEVYSCALRGRGEGWKHNLEIRKDNVSNTITTV